MSDSPSACPSTFNSISILPSQSIHAHGILHFQVAVLQVDGCIDRCDALRGVFIEFSDKFHGFMSIEIDSGTSIYTRHK
jgi:hypothetical protein